MKSGGWVCVNCGAEFPTYNAELQYRKGSGDKIKRVMVHSGSGAHHRSQTGHIVKMKAGPRI